MKIITFLTLLLMPCSKLVLGQENDTVRAVITYAFSHLRDTTEGSKPYTENMDLLLSAHSSWYKSGDKVRNDSIIAANFKASGNKVITDVPYTREELFMDFTDGKFLIKERFFDDYLMEDSWPVIDWQISSETRIISDLNCQKATGEWKGRTYIAWFCSELPYRAGPWKLNGLPGLIVEAYDTDKEVVFGFAGFKTVPKGTEVIQFPTKGIKATVEEYRQMMEAFYQDRKGTINAITGKNTIVSENKGAKKPKSGRNNPMELPGN